MKDLLGSVSIFDTVSAAVCIAVCMVFLYSYLHSSWHILK